jgi:hypothetical protein
VGEAMSDVLTPLIVGAMSDVLIPLSWSVIRALDEEQKIVPGYYLFSGNICGRAYTNISLGLSLYPAFGIDIKRGLKMMSEVFGHMPEGMSIPVYLFSRLSLIKTMAPNIKRRIKKMIEAYKALPQHVKETPEWCRKMTAQIGQVQTEEELLTLWKNELWPYNTKALWVVLTGGRKVVIAFKLKEELTKLIGMEDTNTLLSNFRGNSALESLGPVVGISKIIKGEMSSEEYLMRYGHRGPHEFELSIPHPAEDANWLDKQIEEFKKSDVDAEQLLKRNRAQYEEAWKRFQERYPEKVQRIEKKLANTSMKF